jgi:hypothetical protein
MSRPRKVPWYRFQISGDAVLTFLLPGGKQRFVKRGKHRATESKARHDRLVADYIAHSYRFGKMLFVARPQPLVSILEQRPRAVVVVAFVSAVIVTVVVAVVVTVVALTEADCHLLMATGSDVTDKQLYGVTREPDRVA